MCVSLWGNLCGLGSDPVFATPRGLLSDPASGVYNLLFEDRYLHPSGPGNTSTRIELTAAGANRVLL